MAISLAWSSMHWRFEQVSRRISSLTMYYQVAFSSINLRQKLALAVAAELASASDEQDLLYEMFRYKDAQAVLADSTHFSVCLGASLTRLEAGIALEQFIERFKYVRIVREVPLQHIPSHAMYGVQQLPLRVQRR